METIAHCNIPQSALLAPTVVAMNEKAATAFMKMNANCTSVITFSCAHESCLPYLVVVGLRYGYPSRNIGGCDHATDEASFEKEAFVQNRCTGVGCGRINFFASRRRIGIGRTDR